MLAALDEVLERHEGKRTMVFVNTVAMAVTAHTHLVEAGHPEVRGRPSCVVCFVLGCLLFAGV